MFAFTPDTLNYMLLMYLELRVYTKFSAVKTGNIMDDLIC